MGDCPQLQALKHSSWEATAAHLSRYAQLQALSEFLDQPRPTRSSFLVADLKPLTRLQHLRLTQCVHLGYLSLLPCSQQLSMLAWWLQATTCHTVNFASVVTMAV